MNYNSSGFCELNESLLLEQMGQIVEFAAQLELDGPEVSVSTLPILETKM